MKKHLLSIVALAVALLTSTVADAQVHFGVKAGLNLSSLSLSGDLASNLKTSNQAGFFVGATVDASIPLVGIGADASILYDQRSGKIDNGTDTETAKIRYISIPINVKYSIGLADMANVYVATGPQFSFNLDKGNVLDNVSHKDVKAADFFWNVGAGVTLLNHLRVGYTYNIPISKTVDETGYSLKNKTHQVSLTYLF